MENPASDLKKKLTSVLIGFAVSLFNIQAVVGQQPNIVLIIADDAGYADYGFQGSSKIPTPNLDQLAARGVRFTNAYIQSVCSPSRAILATGLYGGRFGYEQNIPTTTAVIGTQNTVGLEPSQTTIFDRLNGLGYRNLVVGKWHLGAHADEVVGGKLIAPGNRPTQQGVGEFFGLLAGARPYFIGDQTNPTSRLIVETLDHDGIVQESVVENQFVGQYLTDVIGEKTAEYITSNFADGPFLIYSSFTAPHTPMQAKVDDLAAIDALNLGLTGNRRVYAAMQLAMDRAVGAILSRIDDPNADGNTQDSIANNTLLIFINDNGGDCCDSQTNSSSNGNLRNGKGTIWEGGIRVPMLMAGAGIAPSMRGSDFEPPVHAVDIVATCFAAAGGVSQQGYFDGVDLRPFINGLQTEDPHEIVYIRRPSNLGLACRAGRFKLYHDRNNGFALFDIESNPSENLSQNLVDRMPNLVADLKRKVTAFDVEFVKRGWNIDNLDVNEFRFREGAFAQANWDVIDGWTNLVDDNGDGQLRLQSDDATSATTLIFRAKNGGDFVATNNLTRANGLEFMANCLEFITRPEGLNGSRTGTIDGSPVMLTNSPDGSNASIKLNSFDSSQNFMTFNWQTELLLYDDLFVSGNGNDIYEFSGSIREYRPGRSLFKSGSSSLRLSGENGISGAIRLDGGEIVAMSSGSLGTANVDVRQPARLTIVQGLNLSEKQSLSGDGLVEGNVSNGGLVMPGSERQIATLRIVGEYSQSQQGELSIQIEGATSGEHDKLQVAGNVFLNGDLVVNSTAPVNKGTEIQIIATDGSVIGQFQSVANLGTGNWVADYRADGVWLIASQSALDSVPVEMFKIANGLLVAGDVASLAEKDNVKLVVQAEQPINQSSIEMVLTGMMPNNAISSLSFEIVGSSNTPNVDVTVEAYDFDSDEFVTIDEFEFNENSTCVIEFPEPVARFIGPQDQQLISRLQWRQNGIVLFYPWQVEIDRLAWLFAN